MHVLTATLSQSLHIGRSWLSSLLRSSIQADEDASPGAAGTTQEVKKWAKVHLLDVEGVGEEHGEAVDAHAPATGGRQAILQRRAEGLVHIHCLVIPSCLCLPRREAETLDREQSSALL